MGKLSIKKFNQLYQKNFVTVSSVQPTDLQGST
ncbi:unnamed protein product [Acanthoscelides obtectus]|uniref:Uncharacterized protein n=1 Tax=Acanthoscelides obtectus TaxID=200917 RepID=A0A9P0L5E9_ACAOB|nr:unnamed protein product [Acanthoscelides obtectus]CAK1677885.1 hypothetical protein AOBTE_LOCUS31617 [Acanthoscelides obtectus]